MQHHLYPDHWKQRSQACLEQAGYRCEGCGIPHDSMRHDRKTERQRVVARRQGYQVVSLTHLVTVARAAGLSIMPEGTGCAWLIGDLSGVASDVLDAIGSALHCLLMECMEVQA
jgi:hypothetical protein